MVVTGDGVVYDVVVPADGVEYDVVTTGGVEYEDVVMLFLLDSDGNLCASVLLAVIVTLLVGGWSYCFIEVVVAWRLVFGELGMTV